MSNESPWIVQYGPLITASATFIASIIALFKESIIGLWKHPTLKIEQKEENLLKEITTKLSEEESDKQANTSATHIAVDYYDFNIEVINSGSEPCKNCECYLERIEFKQASDVKFNDLDLISGKAIKWLGKELTNIDLPPHGGKASITLLRLISPEKRSTEKGKKKNSPGIQIGDVIINENVVAGNYIIIFCMYSLNHKSQTIRLGFDWNGHWQERITELSSTVKIKMEIRK